MQNENVVTYERRVSGEPIYDQDLIKSPWTIDTADFTKIENLEIIDRTVNVLKNDRTLLVLASDNGTRYGNTILIRFDDETLSIDKPLGFDETSIIAFRVYYQDILNVWNFFETKIVSDCPYTLCATYPEAIYRLQRRKYDRVQTPDGTRAVFWQNDKIHDAGIVKDISATGMLICTCNVEAQFHEDSDVREIAIALPRHPASTKVNEDGNLMLPIIKKGKIVRSFRDKKTDFICHGISFEDTPDISEKLDKYVAMQMKNGTQD